MAKTRDSTAQGQTIFSEQRNLCKIYDGLRSGTVHALKL